MWKEYFTFSATERRGLIFLTVIVIIIFIVRITISSFVSEADKDFSEIKSHIDSFNESLTEKVSGKSIFIDEKSLFPFDPNNTSDNDWKRLGLNERQIKTINHYLKSGGKFVNRDDIRKIYGIPVEIADELIPFIYISYENESDIDSAKSESMYRIFFDPNDASDSLFLAIGFSNDLIRTINNYRKSGGKFNSSDDLLKIYGISDKFYNEIKDWIVIKDPEVENYSESQDYITIDINSADSISLLVLKGIGPVFASRIIKYRNFLGGYVSVNQLLEVYGMDSLRFKEIENYIYINPEKVKKISLNFSSLKELESHPYLTKEDAKSLIQFRSARGNFEKTVQVIKENLVDENTYQKILPYLCVN